MPRVLPLRISIRDCLFLILLVIFNTMHVTDMATNDMDLPKEKKSLKESIDKTGPRGESDDYLKSCQNEKNYVLCTELQYPCIICNRSIDCIYGALTNYTCEVRDKVRCNSSSVTNSDRIFNRTAICRFCYQTEKWEHRCEQKANCNSLASPLKFYSTNCTVSDDVVCLGNRRFTKKIRCSWTAGIRWGIALFLALTLGGFGADRFYLGHWQEGIGKLFSFGGLGVWTLIDALLIGIHHLGPADGSLYI